MKQNFDALKKKNPILYQEIEDHTIEKYIEVVESRDQLKIYRIKDSYGRLFYTHSQYKAHRDVETLMESVDLNAKFYIVFGFGIGIEVKNLLQRKTKAAKIVVIEPDLDLLKYTLQEIDIHHLIESPDVYLLGGELSGLSKQFDLYADKMIIYSAAKPELIQMKFMNRLYKKEILLNYVKELRENIISRSMRIGNSVEDTLLGINHFFSNIQHAFNSPQLRKAQKYYSGRPAICVASGPSLDKNIDLIKDIQDKALIFCADSAYEKLIQKGIVADAISVMERPKLVYNLFFKEKAHLFHKNTCLLSQIVAYPKIFEEYPSTKIVCSKKALPFEQRASEKIPTMNNFYNGLSCAHLSFATAILLGCNPIIMVGQDLSYSSTGNTHAKSTYGENKNEKDDNSIKYEILSYDKKRKVLTTSIWDTFRRWFEEVIAGNSGFKYINATEGGANIEGAEPLPLKQVIERYIQHRDIKPVFKDVMENTRENVDKDLMKKEAIDYFKSEFKSFKTIERNLQKTSTRFEKLYKRYLIFKNKADILNEKDFNSLIKGVNELESAYLENDNLAFITQAMQARFRQIVHKNSHIEDVETFLALLKGCAEKVDELMKTMEKIKFEYERGITILETGVIDSIDTPLMNEMYEG